MAKTHRSKEVHEHARLSLDLARKNVERVQKLVDDDPGSSDMTHKILRELSLIVFRVGEAIVDQVAAASAK